MTSPHAYFALSFVFSVLFFSQHCVGSRVSQLKCFAEGVASVWFHCEWFYVCDQVGMPPLFEVCQFQHTFDLGSMRCQSVKHLHEMDANRDGPLSEEGLEGERRFPCRPFEGTDEKYWFQILKPVNNTAQGGESYGGNSEHPVHEDRLQPPQGIYSGRPVHEEWLQPPREFESARAMHPEWIRPTQDRHRHTEHPEWDYYTTPRHDRHTEDAEWDYYTTPRHDRHTEDAEGDYYTTPRHDRHTEDAEWDYYTTPHHDRHTEHPEWDYYTTPRHDRHTKDAEWDYYTTPRHDRHTEHLEWDYYTTPRHDSDHSEPPHGAEYIPTAEML